MAPDLDAIANAIVLAAGRMADQSSGRPPVAAIVANLADDLRAAWPTGPEYLPEWYAGYEAAMVDVARAEAARAISERPSIDSTYICPDWSTEERHIHKLGGRAWQHAHKGGHEAHSAVSHDLSDAVDHDGTPVPRFEDEEATAVQRWCSYDGQPERLHTAPCAGGHWIVDEDRARHIRYALGGEPASMGGDA